MHVSFASCTLCLSKKWIFLHLEVLKTFWFILERVLLRLITLVTVNATELQLKVDVSSCVNQGMIHLLKILPTSEWLTRSYEVTNTGFAISNGVVLRADTVSKNVLVWSWNFWSLFFRRTTESVPKKCLTQVSCVRQTFLSISFKFIRLSMIWSLIVVNRVGFSKKRSFSTEKRFGETMKCGWC